ncbi:transcription antitermination factor NusB [Psychrobacter sp. PAMC 21119]|uniref:transcription antitermination factor NusB n=1 Tax=Psychrobacter sp. PAMC 21119 TaxID=1112209 RepID=UPI000287EA86|nr:transcription antitermination factor NusB [Psychrobacter sp. PAMC 21119]
MTDQLKRAINAAKTAQTNDSQAEATRIASSSAGDQTFDMSESSYKTSHTAIRKARRFAMQGLYEWLVTDRRFDVDGKLGWKANAPHDIAARTRATNAMHTVHIGYYHEMMRDIPEQIEALDALISQYLDREIDKLDTVEHAILLIGSYELQNRLEIPYKVVLDEAMKLNNHFGATDAHKLINAVLDKMAVELRATEVEADSKANLRTSQKAAAKPVVESDTDNSADTHAMEETLTASNKPRISANNATVKRSSVSKASANISDFKASKKDAAENTVENDSVETVTAAEPIVEESIVEESIVEERIVEKDIVVDEQPIEENVAADAVNDDSDEENTTADTGLTDSNILNVDSEETTSDVTATDDTDTKSQD